MNEELLSGVPDAIFGENRLPKNGNLLTCYSIDKVVEMEFVTPAQAGVTVVYPFFYEGQFDDYVLDKRRSSRSSIWHHQTSHIPAVRR